MCISQVHNVSILCKQLNIAYNNIPYFLSTLSIPVVNSNFAILSA